jgi:hypothetical protein
MKMPGAIIQALKLVPEKDVDGMFDQLIVYKAMQIEGRFNEELIELKAEIKAIREIKNWFKSERARE